MKKTLTVKTLYDYQPDDPTHLAFAKDEIIVISKRLDSGWCYGQIGPRKGWFPSNYCGKVNLYTIGNIEEQPDVIDSEFINTLGQLTTEGVFYKDQELITESGIVYTWGGLSVHVIHSIRNLLKGIKTPNSNITELANKVLEAVHVLLDSSAMLDPLAVLEDIRPIYSELILGLGDFVVAIKESITQNTIANKLNGIHISPADPLSDRRPSLATVNVKSKVDQFEGSNDSNDVTEKLFELMKLVRDFATLCGQYELPITQPSPTSAQKLGWSIGLDTDDVDQMAQILEQDVERVVRVILYQSQSDTLDNVDTISTIKEILMSSGDLVSKCDGIVGTFDGADSDQVEYQVSRLSLLNGITKVVQLCQQLYNGDDLRRLSTTSDEKRVSFMGGQTDPAWLTKELISSLRTVLKLSTELVYQLKYILNEKQAKLSYFLQVAVQKSPEQLAHAGLLNASRDLVGERRGSEMSAGSRGSYIPRHSYQSSRQSRQSQQSK